MKEVIIQVDDCFHPVDQFLNLLCTEIGTLLYTKYFEDAYTDINKLLEDLRVFEEEATPEENNGIVLSVHGVTNLMYRKTFFRLLPSKAKSKLPRSGFVMGEVAATLMDSTPEHTGGSVNYYKVEIDSPVNPKLEPYTAECLDIALELDMTIEEFNIFKAIWRTAAERTLGLAKEGNNAKYDAEKIKFFADVNLRRYL